MSVAGHLNTEPFSLSTAVQNSLTVFFQREADTNSGADGNGL
jgi:hypothetical protein